MCSQLSTRYKYPCPLFASAPVPPSQVWPVTVRPTGLGCTKSLSGESRLCLTATSLILVRVTACSDLPSLTIPLLSVRRFGHLDGSFYLELGRSAPNGPGEIWMGARDQGDDELKGVAVSPSCASPQDPDFLSALHREPGSRPSHSRGGY